MLTICHIKVTRPSAGRVRSTGTKSKSPAREQNQRQKQNEVDRNSKRISCIKNASYDLAIIKTRSHKSNIQN